MKFAYKLLLLLPFLLLGCKETTKNTSVVSQDPKNEIQYASGLAIYKYDGYSVVKVLNPWPKAEKPFTYILKQQNGVVPDSLNDYTTVTVPLQKLVVTSTTIIPFLEMLDSETKLIGFPHTDYISSTKTRALIDRGNVRDVGQNESLNIELLFDMQPDAIVTFGVDNTNPMVDKLTSNGLHVLFQGDWMEQSPLGKAEWIKFYAALLGKEKEGDSIFNSIANNYKQTLTLVKDKAPQEKVLYGSL